MAYLRHFVRNYCPSFIMVLYRKGKLVRTRRIWRKNNKHNGTMLKSMVDTNLVKCGNYTYGDLDVIASSGIPHRLIIGNFCSIASDVKFFLTGNHEMKTVSTFPFDVRIFGELPKGLGNGNIVIKDDVWIGQRCLIMSGVTIGQGAVVDAGAVVTKDVPPYAIVGGCPAKIIRYRFSDEIISELLNLDYSNLDYETIKMHKELSLKKIDRENVSEIVSLINNKIKLK